MDRSDHRRYDGGDETGADAEAQSASERATDQGTANSHDYVAYEAEPAALASASTCRSTYRGLHTVTHRRAAGRCAAVSASTTVLTAFIMPRRLASAVTSCRSTQARHLPGVSKSPRGSSEV